MKLLKRFLSAVICAILMFTSAATDVMSFHPFSITAEAASTILNYTDLKIAVGQEVSLKANTSEKVKWSSNKKSVAKVSSNGVITGVKKGTATITATVGAKKYQCVVKVVTPKINKTEVKTKKGSTVVLSLGITTGVKWYSENPYVATVNSKGKVKVLKKGIATIRGEIGMNTFYCEVNSLDSKYDKTNIGFGIRYSDGIVWLGNSFTPRRNCVQASEYDEYVPEGGVSYEQNYTSVKRYYAAPTHGSSEPFFKGYKWGDLTITDVYTDYYDNYTPPSYITEIFYDPSIAGCRVAASGKMSLECVIEYNYSENPYQSEYYIADVTGMFGFLRTSLNFPMPDCAPVFNVDLDVTDKQRAYLSKYLSKDNPQAVFWVTVEDFSYIATAAYGGAFSQLVDVEYEMELSEYRQMMSGWGNQ